MSSLRGIPSATNGRPLTQSHEQTSVDASPVKENPLMQTIKENIETIHMFASVSQTIFHITYNIVTIKHSELYMKWITTFMLIYFVYVNT